MRKRIGIITYINIAQVFIAILCVLPFYPIHGAYRKYTNDVQRHKNGLIYSDTSLLVLRKSFDSLQTIYRKTKFSKHFRASYQAHGYYMSASTTDRQIFLNMKSAMRLEIPFFMFCKSYRLCINDQSNCEPILRFKENDFDKNCKIMFRQYGGENNSILLPNSFYQKYNVKDKWLFAEEIEAELYQVSGFYFVDDFKKEPLPEKYDKMVQYFEYLTDTGSDLILQDYRLEFAISLKHFSHPKLDHFLKLIDADVIEKGSRSIFDHEINWKVYTRKFETDPAYKIALQEAIGVLIDSNQANYMVEIFAGHFATKQQYLYLKRLRRVISMCNRDPCSFYHILEISKLSAETTDYKNFLKAHFTLVDKAFRRDYDDKYFMKERKIYFDELQALDLNLYDLVFGMSLKVSNPATHHYSGSVLSTAKAISETKTRAIFEKRAVEMIADNNLDDNNRIAIIDLYSIYLQFLNKEECRIKLKQFQIISKKLPDFLKDRINGMEDPKH